MNKKYPISKNNFKCLTPCLKPGQWILHPMKLEYMTNELKPFCLVEDYKALINNKYQILNIDICDNPIELNNKNHEKSLNEVIIPTFELLSKDFLLLYYNIKSFEDTSEYINNKNNIPYLTKERLLNNSFKSFGPYLNELNDNILLTYQNIFKNDWIDYIYDNIYNYIKVDKNNFIKLIDIDKKINKNKDKDLKIKYILKKFINKEFCSKFLKYYIKNTENFEKIYHHLEKQKNLLIFFIINKIKKSV